MSNKMNTWIPINLPWSCVPAAIETAAVRKRKRADTLYVRAQRIAEIKVGQTIKAANPQLDEVRLANLRLKWHDATMKDLGDLWCSDLEKVKKKYPIINKNLVCTPPDVCDEVWLKEVHLVARRNPVALALAQCYHTKWKVITLADQQPEAEQARALEEEAKTAVRGSTFRSVFGYHEMCRPGVLIEVQSHETGEIRQMLIGHIGPQLIEEQDLVLRACVVWEPK
jgi:hypothetical protein